MNYLFSQKYVWLLNRLLLLCLALKNGWWIRVRFDERFYLRECWNIHIKCLFIPSPRWIEFLYIYEGGCWIKVKYQDMFSSEMSASKNNPQYESRNMNYGTRALVGTYLLLSKPLKHFLQSSTNVFFNPKYNIIWTFIFNIPRTIICLAY